MSWRRRWRPGRRAFEVAGVWTVDERGVPARRNLSTRVGIALRRPVRPQSRMGTEHSEIDIERLPPSNNLFPVSPPLTARRRLLWCGPAATAMPRGVSRMDG